MNKAFQEKSTYQIVSDGSCDLPVELAKEKNIAVVPFYVSFDDTNYLKENVEIGIRDFYQQMVERKGVYPKSSMPSAQDYAEVFQPYVQAGIPVICICITTKFSGSMQSALNAREMMLETNPEAQITVIDSTVDTVLQGQYVLEAAAMRDSSVLGIRPIITLKQGEIFPSGIGRGRKHTTEKTIGLLLDYLAEGGKKIDDYSIAVGFGYDMEEGAAFRDHAMEVLRSKGYAVKEMLLLQIGATIGVHTGPYPLGFGVIERGNIPPV